MGGDETDLEAGEITGGTRRAEGRGSQGHRDEPPFPQGVCSGSWGAGGSGPGGSMCPGGWKARLLRLCQGARNKQDPGAAICTVSNLPRSPGQLRRPSQPARLPLHAVRLTQCTGSASRGPATGIDEALQTTRTCQGSITRAWGPAGGTECCAQQREPMQGRRGRGRCSGATQLEETFSASRRSTPYPGNMGKQGDGAW